LEFILPPDARFFEYTPNRSISPGCWPDDFSLLSVENATVDKIYFSYYSRHRGSLVQSGQSVTTKWGILFYKIGYFVKPRLACTLTQGLRRPTFREILTSEFRQKMSPFAQFLIELRSRNGLRQAELAEAIGYDQSYVSALEIGIKGPPTEEFVDRLTQAFSLPEIERTRLHDAVESSQRKLVIDPDAPPEVFLLLNELRRGVNQLLPVQIRMIREALNLPGTVREERLIPIRRLKRRKKEEAQM
jgi:transcriptional regulator with XRE-family HTH domain